MSITEQHRDSLGESNLRLARWTLIVTIGIFIVYALLLVVAWDQSATSTKALQLELKRLADSNEKADNEAAESKKRSWQELVIYKAIDDGFAENKLQRGLSFDDIKTRYLQEAQIAADLPLTKEDISPAVLRRILFDFIAEGLAYKTDDDRYVVQRSVLNPRFTRSFVVIDAEYAVLQAVSVDNGRYTAQQLQQKICQERAITPEEFTMAVNLLVGAGGIKVDAEQKLWAVANAPPPLPVKTGGK